MKILVTGGAGFIGSHLADYLIDKEHEVVVIDDLSLGKKENIEHNLVNRKFTFYQENILNYEQIEGIFIQEKFDVIFHLAANSDISKSHAEPDIDFNNTFFITYNILKLMKCHMVKKIVFSSTSAIYGENSKKLAEDFGPLLPVSHYGASKLASEAFICSFVLNYDMQAWIVRFPNVVGERATHGVIFDFINKLRKNHNELEVLGNGEQFKPYMYVKDLVEAMIFVWRNSNDRINIFNIGVETKTRVKDIVRMVIEEMGLNAVIKYRGGDRGWIGDVPGFDYDLSKITSLGWVAKISSDEAVRKSIKQILSTDPQWKK